MITNLAFFTIAAVPYVMKHLTKPHPVIRKTMKIMKKCIKNKQDKKYGEKKKGTQTSKC